MLKIKKLYQFLLKSPVEFIISHSGWLFIIIAIIHAFSMVVVPLSKYQSWIVIQDVWDRWQTFNTGMLGFYAAILTIWQIRHFNKITANQRFKGQRVILSGVLSDLTEYNRHCAEYLDIIWKQLKLHEMDEPDHLDGATRKSKAQLIRNKMSPPPGPYTGHSALFGEMIEHGHTQQELATALHRLSSRIQILNSRVQSFSKSAYKDIEFGQAKERILSLAVYLIRNQAYTELLFPFSLLDAKPNSEVPYYVDASLTIENIAQGFSNLPFKSMQSVLENDIQSLLDPDSESVPRLSLTDSLEI